MLREGIKKPEDIKIHTYCIAGNEMKFLDRFLNNMREVGCESLSIMCTKSEDGTWERLQEVKANDEYWKDRLIIEYKEIKPWRFDVARNESMKLVPEDADYLFCIDEDEMLTPGFFQKVKERIFEVGYIPERIFYRYAWSHKADGSNDIVFWYDKFCGSKGWAWRGACHEALHLDAQCKDLYGPAIHIDNGETIWLHHWPDNTKSRGSYIGLLKVRCEEDPDDLYSYFYYGRELTFHRQNDEAIAWLTKLYFKLCKQGVKDDMLMKPATALEIARLYMDQGAKEEAEFFFKRAIELDPRIADSYISYAQWLAYQGRPGDSFAVLKEKHEKSVVIEDWRTRPFQNTSWKEKQIIADNMCWLNQYELAWAIIQSALNEIEETGAQDNARTAGFYNDYDFIKNKLGITE